MKKSTRNRGTRNLSFPYHSLRRGNRFVEIRDLSIELLLVDRLQDLANARPRRQAECEKMAAEQDRTRRAMLDAKRARSLEKPVHRRAIELARVSAEAVRFRQPCEKLEINLLRQAAERPVPNFVAYLVPGSRLQMMGDEAEHLSPHVVAVDRMHVDPIQKQNCGCHPLFFVIHRTDA